jgi:hypothetical protein
MVGVISVRLVRPRLFAGVVCVVILAVVMGCGEEASGADPKLPGVPYGSPAPSGQQNDPAVSASADQLDSLLRRDFAASYAGLVLNHDEHTLVVYRKPDARLDARARSAVTDVIVELRDARMSLREMEGLRDRVMADRDYWSQQGVSVSSAGPKPDGSGVEVMTSTGSSGDRKKLTKRYGVDAITVTKGSLVFPTAPVWTGFHTASSTPS